jgi:hypothetical protein
MAIPTTNIIAMTRFVNVKVGPRASGVSEPVKNHVVTIAATVITAKDASVHTG